MKKIKLLTSVLFSLLSLSILAQNYHELSRPERRTISCDNVLELSDGNIISLEDHGYFDNVHWNIQGVYIMKMNNKAELLDSLYIDFPYEFTRSELIRNPYKEGNNLFAKLYYNKENTQYQYKAVFFDDNLDITETIDVPINCEKVVLNDGLRLFLDLNNNWMISARDIYGNYVFLTMDLYGNLIYENNTQISTEKYRRLHECMFVYDKDEELYGFFCADLGHLESEDGHKTIFILDNKYNTIASYSLYKLDDVKINTANNVDPMMIEKETGELIMVSPVGLSNNLSHSYLQVTEFDKEMNIIRYRRIDKGAITLDEYMRPHYSSISLRKDGSMYINWNYHNLNIEFTQGYLTLLDKDLNVIWETQYYERYNAWLMNIPQIVSMQTLSNGNLAIAGTNVYDYYDLDSSHPYVVIFEDNSSSTSEQPSLVLPYSFYPNPADDVISLRFSPDVNCEKVEIFSIDGKLCLSQNFNLNAVDINTLSSGIYMMKVTLSNGNVYTEKVVKK